MTQGSAKTTIEVDDQFFLKSGSLPIRYDDRRRFARSYYRYCVDATIYPPDGEQVQSPKQHVLLTCDLSRGGVSILHYTEFFPGQRLDIAFDGNAPRRVKVVWCRRISGRFYAAGCRFITPEDSQEPPE